MMRWDDDDEDDNNGFGDPEFSYACPDEEEEASFGGEGDDDEHRSRSIDEDESASRAREATDDDGISEVAAEVALPKQQHVGRALSSATPQESSTAHGSDTANAVAVMARAAMEEEQVACLQSGSGNTSAGALVPAGVGHATLRDREGAAFLAHVRRVLTEYVVHPTKTAKTALLESMSHDARHALFAAPPLIADDDDIGKVDEEEWKAPPGAPFWEPLARVSAALAFEKQRETALGEEMLFVCEQLGIANQWGVCMRAEPPTVVSTTAQDQEADVDEQLSDADELAMAEQMKTNPLLRMNKDGILAQEDMLDDASEAVAHSAKHRNAAADTVDASPGSGTPTHLAPPTRRTASPDANDEGTREMDAAAPTMPFVDATAFQSILAALPPPTQHSLSTVEGQDRFAAWEHGLRRALFAEEDVNRMMHEVDETVRTVCDASVNDLQTNWDLASKPAAVPVHRQQELDNLTKETCVLTDCIARVGRQLDATRRNVETKQALFDEACAERRATEVILSADEMREAHRQIGAMEAEIRQMSAKDFLPKLVEEQVQDLVRTLYQPQMLRNHDELHYLRGQIAMLDNVEHRSGLAQIGTATPKHVLPTTSARGGKVSLSDQAVFLDSLSTAADDS